MKAFNKNSPVFGAESGKKQKVSSILKEKMSKILLTLWEIDC